VKGKNVSGIRPSSSERKNCSQVAGERNFGVRTFWRDSGEMFGPVRGTPIQWNSNEGGPQGDPRDKDTKKVGGTNVQKGITRKGFEKGPLYMGGLSR